MQKPVAATATIHANANPTPKRRGRPAKKVAQLGALPVCPDGTIHFSLEFRYYDPKRRQMRRIDVAGLAGLLYLTDDEEGVGLVDRVRAAVKRWEKDGRRG